MLSMFVSGISFVGACLWPAAVHAVVSVWLAYDKCVLVVEASDHTQCHKIYTFKRTQSIFQAV